MSLNILPLPLKAENSREITIALIYQSTIKAESIYFFKYFSKCVNVKNRNFTN